LGSFGPKISGQTDAGAGIAGYYKGEHSITRSYCHLPGKAARRLESQRGLSTSTNCELR
jgi:hypothetical protein